MSRCLHQIVTRTQVSSRVLSPEEAVGFTSCTKVAGAPLLQEVEGDLVSWEEGDWRPVGDLQQSDIE